jgi:hypothetical protein
MQKKRLSISSDAVPIGIEKEEEIPKILHSFFDRKRNLIHFGLFAQWENGSSYRI